MRNAYSDQTARLGGELDCIGHKVDYHLFHLGAVKIQKYLTLGYAGYVKGDIPGIRHGLEQKNQFPHEQREVRLGEMKMDFVVVHLSEVSELFNMFVKYAGALLYQLKTVLSTLTQIGIAKQLVYGGCNESKWRFDFVQEVSMQFQLIPVAFKLILPFLVLGYGNDGGTSAEEKQNAVDDICKGSSIERGIDSEIQSCRFRIPYAVTAGSVNDKAIIARGKIKVLD